MKKLLSLLGSIGMVATAGMAVVACGSKNSDNASASYSDFSKWVDDSKAKDGVAENQIIFIGGRKDSDTLSWLAAESLMAGNKDDWKDIKKLTDTKNLSSIDSKFSGFVSNTSDPNNNYKSITSNSNSTPGDPKVINGTAFVWGDVKNNEFVNKPSDKISFHSVLVDNLSSFWSSSLGKDIKDKLVSDQVDAGVDYFYKYEHLNSVPKDKEIKSIKNKVKKAVKGKLTGNGPFFLMISNGKLVGITSGYKNYIEFNQSLTDKSTKLDGSKDKAIEDFKVFYNYLANNIYGVNIDTFIKDFFMTDSVDDKSELIKADSKAGNWSETSNKNSTVDKINLAQLSFNVDLNKYN